MLPAPGISIAENGSAECTHGCNTVTPPEGISPSAMMKPDPEKTYFHDPMMSAEIMPSEELQFDIREDAYNFYCYYARMAGFDVRITKTHPTVGLFCEHLLKAFTHLQIIKVPPRYILKRYTRDARYHLMWDRNDIVTMGPDCTTEQFRTSKLVSLAMAAVRAYRMSKIGFETGCENLEALTGLAKSIPADIGPSAQGNRTNDGSSDSEDQILASAPPVAEDMEVSMSAPQPARTKGSKRTGKEICCEEPRGRRQKDEKSKQQCKSCGLYTGHYSTTCPLNPVVAARGRGGSRGRRGTMGTKRGRPPINRQLEQDFLQATAEEEEEDIDEEMDSIGDD
ncbi:hypothetical protein PR202_gb00748 [Eleusine coracana subsp. coracana]|uniref:Protein FAR1-RELATED SEQUENCE n=1 Tax=Eleusine coracana subsp. coracana TaxID=191504 RepID=A0AAV5DUT9_ELECO|nr:hypothetical protein PR202_gb00748 [Eleusine coracana subsp. coracana]